MPHYTPLIATIVVGLTLAFVFGVVAHRLRISPLVGYLLAGVAVGPFTPGFVADGPGYLTDPRGGRRLRFLHWAGVPIGPGGPYWDVWRHWRERDPALPPTTLPAVRWTPPLAPRRRARAAAALRRTVARLAAVLPGGR